MKNILPNRDGMIFAATSDFLMENIAKLDLV